MGSVGSSCIGVTICNSISANANGNAKNLDQVLRSSHLHTDSGSEGGEDDVVVIQSTAGSEKGKKNIVCCS